MKENLEAYAQAACCGTSSHGLADGLCGRILHGKSLKDFQSLTNDPNRKLVMLVGPDGLQKLIGKTGYDVLVEIGYTQEYLHGIAANGERFNLVVFPFDEQARLATWDNVIDLVAQTYPAAAAMLRTALVALKNTPYRAFEAQCGFRFADVTHKNDPRFMTIDRLLASSGSPADVRAFLYHSVHLRELFAGDGFTYTCKGCRGVAEYIAPNRDLASLGTHVIVDLEITFPES